MSFPQFARAALVTMSLNLSLSGASAIAQSPNPVLFSVSSRELGLFQFDLKLEETRRDYRSSIVRATGFHGRPTASTHWMMCMLNALAIQRGFEYWTVVYPDHPSEDLLIGFMEYAQEKIAEKDARFRNKQAIPIIVPIEKGVQFCKTYRASQQPR